MQVLRDLNFEFDNLERRSANGNGADGSNVTLWTNHRVMEWLRVVDLAEYAPNMRGSGVHGGLIIHEGRFTSELLATLLSIPPSKTLLRRHLTTHFNQILGREVVQHKREIESTLGFVPLTLTARLKVCVSEFYLTLHYTRYVRENNLMNFFMIIQFFIVITLMSLFKNIR